MEPTSGGDRSSAERRRSSPSKTKGQGHASGGSKSPRMSDLHRSQSHEPRQTPPLFLMSSAAERSVLVPVSVSETPDATGHPSSSSSRLLDSGETTSKEINADDKETDNVDKKSTSSGGRDTVVQLNVDSKTEVVVDGGKSFGGGGGDSGFSVAGKTSPADGCEVGISGGQIGYGGGRSWIFRLCRAPFDAIASCHAAWLGGIGLAQDFVHGLLTTHLRLIKRILLALVLVGFAAYLVVAVWKSGLCAIAVIIVAALGVLIQSLRLLKRFCGYRIHTYIVAPVTKVRHSRPCLCLKWYAFFVFIASLIFFFFSDIIGLRLDAQSLGLGIIYLRILKP